MLGRVIFIYIPRDLMLADQDKRLEIKLWQNKFRLKNKKSLRIGL
jgi:hypothetical protein